MHQTHSRWTAGARSKHRCVSIQPAHFASTEEVQYVNGENKLTNASAEAEGIEFGVNAACELVGVKKGKGLVETSLELQNVKGSVKPPTSEGQRRR